MLTLGRNSWSGSFPTVPMGLQPRLAGTPQDAKFVSSGEAQEPRTPLAANGARTARCLRPCSPRRGTPGPSPCVGVGRRRPAMIRLTHRDYQIRQTGAVESHTTPANRRSTIWRRHRSPRIEIGPTSPSAGSRLGVLAISSRVEKRYSIGSPDGGSGIGSVLAQAQQDEGPGIGAQLLSGRGSALQPCHGAARSGANSGCDLEKDFEVIVLWPGRGQPH